jgi:hypothetical protein
LNRPRSLSVEAGYDIARSAPTSLLHKRDGLRTIRWRLFSSIFVDPYARDDGPESLTRFGWMSIRCAIYSLLSLLCILGSSWNDGGGYFALLFLGFNVGSYLATWGSPAAQFGSHLFNLSPGTSHLPKATETGVPFGSPYSVSKGGWATVGMRLPDLNSEFSLADRPQLQAPS